MRYRSRVFRGASILFYCKQLQADNLTRSWLVLLIRDHRRRIGSRYRRLDEREQALLVLVYLDDGETYLDLAASFDVGAAYSGKHTHHGVNVQVIAGPKREVLWVSAVAARRHPRPEGRTRPQDPQRVRGGQAAGGWPTAPTPIGNRILSPCIYCSTAIYPSHQWPR
jgi:hypothetical protein